MLSASAALVMVGLLDLLTPSDVSFGQLYVVPVVLVAWAFGWRWALVTAALVSATELIVDSPVFRSNEVNEPLAILMWNALSSFVAFAVVGVVTDRFYEERERWKAVSAERARLLRLLEREFPRPLRAIDWFARTFEEALDRQLPMPSKVREGFASLRHHSRELDFLATDLLRIGRVRSGDLEFGRENFDIRQLTKEAADETVDRNRVVVRTPATSLVVSADPEAIRHAISSVIGRLVESSPVELVELLVRESGYEVAIEFTSRGTLASLDDLELAELLITANGGRVIVTPQKSGARIHMYLPRTRAAPSNSADAVVDSVRME